MRPCKLVDIGIGGFRINGTYCKFVGLGLIAAEGTRGLRLATCGSQNVRLINQLIESRVELDPSTLAG